ncbi:hypothetical protein A2U01_0061066, partial [Trifolium medium]|nr:hypothetical protein [Trifolium medium]
MNVSMVKVQLVERVILDDWCDFLVLNGKGNCKNVSTPTL